MDLAALIQVAGILTKRWDPLQVADRVEVPEAEYLHEANEVLALLQIGEDGEGLAAYLAAAAHELGSHTDSARDRRTARALVAWQRARA